MKITNPILKAASMMLAALFLAPMFATAQSAWEEGTHYEVIADKKSETKKVREVFSFWCPHCFSFEPIVDQLKKSLTSDISFIKAHVNFMGSASLEAQDAATLGMLAAKAMKQDHIFNAALFSAIHRERKSINGMDDVVAIFSAAGGDATKLKQLSASFGIKGQVRKNNQLTRGVSSVPAFIINDKYQAQFTRDMTPDSFVQLILWLTEQP